MKGNIKKTIAIIVFIIVTITCILLGIRTRKMAKLVIVQLAGEGNGYVLETSEKKLIIIDGGSKEDSARLQEIIRKKGNNQVLAWFITSPMPNNTGALLEILKENSEIAIEHIYASLNTEEWYEQSDLEEDEMAHIQELMENLYTEENLTKYIDLQRRTRYLLDNYVITPLELRENTSTNIADQTVILKVDNSFKSAIFFGNIGNKESHYFYENNRDQLENDMIQISTDQKESMNQELFEALKTDKIMISGEKKFQTNVPVYTKENGDVVIEIW